MRRSSSRVRANWQRILCRTADYAPASLLLISFVFILSFLPFARLFAYYRSTSGSNSIYRELSYTFATLTPVPALLQKFFDANLSWWLFTAALALLALFLAWRSFRRSRHAENGAL